jgi:hypothetical protein
MFDDEAEEEPRKKSKGEHHETSFEMMKPEAGSLSCSSSSSSESKSSESVSEGSRRQKETASDSKLPVSSRKEELRTKFDKDEASLEDTERKMGSVSTPAARLVTPGAIEKRRSGPREAESSSPDVARGKGQKEHDVVRKLELPGYPVDKGSDDAVLQGYLMEHLSSEKKSSPPEGTSSKTTDNMPTSNHYLTALLQWERIQGNLVLVTCQYEKTFDGAFFMQAIMGFRLQHPDFQAKFPGLFRGAGIGCTRPG